MNVEQVLEQIVGRLQAFPEVERIILFGSRARGDAAPRADIDLAVEAPTADERRWDLIVQRVAETDSLLPRDLVWVDKAPPDLRVRILAEGKVLYERRPQS